MYLTFFQALGATSFYSYYRRPDWLTLSQIAVAQVGMPVIRKTNDKPYEGKNMLKRRETHAIPSLILSAPTETQLKTDFGITLFSL